MTNIYFVRHAQPDHNIRDDLTRPLSEKGLIDRTLVTEFLGDKSIDCVLSSPYKRAIDTIVDFAKKNHHTIQIVDNFRERDSVWVEDFIDFAKKQWADFSYKRSDGECLAEVQKRNISALFDVLTQYKDKNIVIGTHETALSTIINYFDNTYGFDDFIAMANIMPWVVRMKFDGENLVGMWKIDLFEPNNDSVMHTVLTPELGTYKGYEVVAVFARYHNKWLYCRAKTRDVFGMIGGGIENGETPLEAAKRELYEETGATKYSIEPVCDYRGVSSRRLLNGQLFYAVLEELGDLPKEFEIAEVKLFDSIPDKMRFPELLSILFEKVRVSMIKSTFEKER